MPANLTPQYFEAEKWYKQAATTEEKILALEKMLAVIPKHKGTDHLKADLRKKLSSLKEDETKKAAKGKTVDIFHFPKTGAAQIALIGTPNSGKSSVVAAVTNAKVHIADFPFSTSVPVPGMVHYEDIQIELIDMPPVTADYVAPGQIGAYRHCDLVALCMDLSADIAGQINIITDFFQTRNLPIYGKKDANNPVIDPEAKRAFYLCTKSDIAKPDALETLGKLSKYPLPTIVTSTENFEGIETLPRTLFELCDIIRVYTKPPGHKPDLGSPFTLPVGSTVLDLAHAVHRDMTEKLKNARIWGTGVFEGQHVPRDHILCDKDVVELHFS